MVNKLHFFYFTFTKIYLINIIFTKALFITNSVIVLQNAMNLKSFEIDFLSLTEQTIFLLILVENY